MRCKTALFLALGSWFAISAPALADTPVTPAALVATTHELPGFAGAKTALNSTTSPSVFVQEFTRDTPAEAKAQLPELISMGFVEGVQRIFAAPHREAVSESVVFEAAQGAHEELKTALHEDLRTYEKRGLKQASDPAIPGSVSLGDFHVGGPAATDNVLFTTGRCFLLVGDRIVKASTRAQADRAPTAAAKALSKRVKQVCA